MKQNLMEKLQGWYQQKPHNLNGNERWQLHIGGYQ
jgi:hypothetical protein